ncbi:MAG: methyltransferase domain-containing protein [Anaerolineae bacterium]|nr:methyltransferase domain-containing protein [Anaerolineae bacterium]
MNRHSRYLQQAGWTRDLRHYVFTKAGLAEAKHVLEVGCGTGAILADVKSDAALHGLDIDGDALREARIHAPRICITWGDALRLPYPACCFDIVYCHFLLLWVIDPLIALIEMKRVTRAGGYVLALAEPDYTCRVDEPKELAAIGQMQTESLRRRGADVGLGRRLADLFDRAGIHIVETGVIQDRDAASLTPDEHEKEWAVLENDVAGLMPDNDIRHVKMLDAQAWLRGERVLNIPTYFAWGRHLR